MKIVFYNHTGKVSGAERLLLSAVARLDGGQFDRVMVCPADGPLAELAAQAGMMTVQTVADLEARFTLRPDAFIRYGKSFLEVIRAFRRQTIELNPDLIHANSIRAGLVATAATLGLKVKVVWHLHDLLPRHPLSTAIRTVAALSKRSRMIAVSQAVSKNFCGRLSWLLKKRVVVILNAIDVRNFAAVDKREETRTGLSLAQDDFAIGIVGQLTPRKGQMELLVAFEEFSRRVPQAVLVIAGAAIFNRDFEYEQMLQATAERLGISSRVRMLGARKDVPEIMRALDLLVVNSRREPFGLVACEAMACGTPVLATASDGLPEIIDHQKNGWLVPFGDRQKLVDALAFLNQKPDVRKTLARVARKDVAERFALERYLNDLNAFYKTIYDLNSAAEPASQVGQAPSTSFAQ